MEPTEMMTGFPWRTGVDGLPHDLGGRAEPPGESMRRTMALDVGIAEPRRGTLADVFRADRAAAHEEILAGLTIDDLALGMDQGDGRLIGDLGFLLEHR